MRRRRQPPLRAPRPSLAALGAAPGRSPARARQLRHALRARLGARARRTGRTPDFDSPLAPTPHPLGDAARRRALAAQHAADAASTARRRVGLTLVLAFLALGALGWVDYALGARVVRPAAGVLAAAIVLTRRPVLDFGARAYVDIPYLVLVLGALLVETRRRRAGRAGARAARRRRAAAPRGVAVLGRLPRLPVVGRRATCARSRRCVAIAGERPAAVGAAAT